MIRHRTDHRHATRPGSRDHLDKSPGERAVLAASAGVADGARRATGPKAKGSADARQGDPWPLAKNVSALLDPDADQRILRRHVRFAQREVLWSQSSLERVKTCGRVPIQEGGVALKLTADNTGYYSGIASCGSIWACPVCSGKVRNRRAQEISKATADWDKAGHSVYMATFTAPHNMGMDLKPLMSAIKDGFRHVISGRPWTRLKKKLGIVGQIRSMEVTHGSNGWHPHLHVLIFVRDTVDAVGLAELTQHLQSRWSTWITSQGYRAPHKLYGVDVSRCHSAQEAGEYIAKTQDGKSPGNEMTRSDLKVASRGSRTPFAILDDFRWTGDLQDLALWGEYERATKGQQAITWSAGLRALLLPDDEEQSNEEIASEEVGGEEVAIIDGDTWKLITRRSGLPAYLLDRLEAGGIPAVNEVLANHEIPELSPCGPLQRKSDFTA